jgi:hypothetical protein
VPKPLDATEQPFGLIPPDRQNDGVDFSRISPYNLNQSNASESSISGTGGKTSSAEGRNLPIPFAAYKEENQFPGMSKMPRLKRNQDESESQYNARVLQEYNKNVIIPSFDKKTQDAIISAMELNKQEPELFKQKLATPENLKKYNDVSAKLKEDRKVIVKTMNELKPKLRNYNKYPANSKERAFLENQFGTLNKQLGFFDDLLN